MEGASLALDAPGLGPDTAAVLHDDALGDGQPQAQAPLARAVGLSKTFEDERQLLPPHPHPRPRPDPEARALLPPSRPGGPPSPHGANSARRWTPDWSRPARCVPDLRS